MCVCVCVCVCCVRVCIQICSVLFACTFINSCHFTCMISSCDCFVLKDIINNWSDEAAVTILNNIHSSMKPGSRLLVMERVMHTSDYEEERVSRVPFQI